MSVSCFFIQLFAYAAVFIPLVQGEFRKTNSLRCETYGNSPYSVFMPSIIPNFSPSVVPSASPSNVPSVDRTIDFQNHVDYPTGGSPTSLAAYDFNKDGVLDLVVCNAGPSTLSILFGNADGTFQNPVDYDTTRGPEFLAISDFNNDGIMDVAVTGLTFLSIHLGNGDGSFQPAIRVPALDLGSEYGSGLAIADFNFDGNADIVMSTGCVLCASRVLMFLGLGTGLFQPHVSYISGTGISSPGPGAYAVIAADFNEDSNMDIAVSQKNKFVNILLGKGDGTFGPPYENSGGGAFLTAADFNSDGKIDIAASDWNSFNQQSFSVFLSNGNGMFQPRVAYETVTLPNRGMVSADMNNDGVIDLITSHWTQSSVSVFLGQGDGSFINTLKQFTTGLYCSQVIAADFNNDELIDLATVNREGASVSILLQK